jgi:Fe2+ transport system protein FeoA
MTTLSLLPRGARAIVHELPPQHGLARRLVALGLNPGVELCMLQNRGRGPLIVEVHGARLALGRGQAERVTVEPVQPAASMTDRGAAEAGPASER